MKKLYGLFIIFTSLMIISTQAFATIISTEPVATNPASTEDLWLYSYDGTAGYISSTADFVRSTDSYLIDVTIQGYVTGASGPWSPSNDSWGNGGNSTTSQTAHIFDTYITSSINQTVAFAHSGDDGHSVFMDDVFLGGGGYNSTAYGSFDMVAHTEYKLTYAGSNGHGQQSWWFNMRSDNYVGATSVAGEIGWAGPVSEASNIYMNAVAGNYSPNLGGGVPNPNAGAPVPEPATAMLLGFGLLGLAGAARKKKG